MLWNIVGKIRKSTSIPKGIVSSWTDLILLILISDACNGVIVVLLNVLKLHWHCTLKNIFCWSYHFDSVTTTLKLVDILGLVAKVLCKFSSTWTECNCKSSVMSLLMCFAPVQYWLTFVNICQHVCGITSGIQRVTQAQVHLTRVQQQNHTYTVGEWRAHCYIILDIYYFQGSQVNSVELFDCDH